MTNDMRPRQEDDNNLVLSPTDVFLYYSSNMNLEVERKKIHLKGTYCRGGDKPYSDFYYDSLHEPNNESIRLSIRVHGSLREKLRNGNFYTLGGFLVKREDKNRNREIGFKLLLTVSEIVEVRSASKESEARLKVLYEQLKIDEERNKIRKEKKLKKRISVEQLVEEKVFSREKISIALLCGMGETKAEGDIMGEIKKLPSAIQGLFEITKRPVSMNSVHDIAWSLKDLDSKRYDLICLSRGGGSKEEIDIFNDLELARNVVNLKTPFLATIGHGTDTPFVEEISDWKDPFNLQPVKIGELLRESAEMAFKKEGERNEQKEMARQREVIMKEKDAGLEFLKNERNMLVKEIGELKKGQVSSIDLKHEIEILRHERVGLERKIKTWLYIAVGLAIVGFIIGVVVSRLI